MDKMSKRMNKLAYFKIKQDLKMSYWCKEVITFGVWCFIRFWLYFSNTVHKKCAGDLFGIILAKA